MRARALLGLLPCCLASLPVLADDLPLRLLAPEVPGLAMRQPDHSIGGPGIEVLAQAMQQAGVKVHFEGVPWLRALREAEQMPGTCVIGLGRRDNNAARFHWAGPVMRQRTVALLPGNSPLQLRSMADLRGLRVGVVRGIVVAKELRELGIMPDETADAAANVRKLQAGRIDVWISNELVARQVFSELGVADYRIAFVIRIQEGFIACNRAVPAEQVARIDTAIRELAGKGRFQLLGL